MQQRQTTAPDLSRAAREQLLRRSFMFSDIDPDLLQQIASLSRIRRLDKGAVLFQRGDDGDALYGVMAGLICISISNDAGKELTIAVLEPGDVFGEIALLDGLSRSASAYAAEDSILLAIERSTFLELLEREPRIARHVIELLCERLRANTDKLGEYAFMSLGARLAKRLHALSIAHGRRGPDGVRIEVKFSQTDLAHMLGATREAVNKQLRLLASQGLIQLDQGYITIKDMARLSAMHHERA